MRCTNCGYERDEHMLLEQYCPGSRIVEQQTFTTRVEVQDRDE